MTDKEKYRFQNDLLKKLGKLQDLVEANLKLLDKNSERWNSLHLDRVIIRRFVEDVKSSKIFDNRGFSDLTNDLEKFNGFYEKQTKLHNSLIGKD